MSAVPGRGRARGRARPVNGHISAAPGQDIHIPDPHTSVIGAARPSPPLAAESHISAGSPGQFKENVSSSLKVCPVLTQRAKRPGYGQAFIKKIPLYANYFDLELPHGVVYQYDVDISNMPTNGPPSSSAAAKKRPTRLPARVTMPVFQKLVSENAVFAKHKPVYDGNKTLVTKYPLDDIIKSKVFQICHQEDVGREQWFIVTVKPALTQHGHRGEVNLEPFHKYIKERKGELPLDAIRVMDLIFRHGPSMQLVPVGRSFFIKPTCDDDLPPFGGGREIWFGYTQSVRPTEWRPMLNVDLTATVFYKEGPLMTFLAQVLGCSQLPDKMDSMTIKRLSKEVSGLRVRATHSPIPRRYTIAKMSNLSARQLKFKLDGVNGSQGTETTVEKYFLDQYRYQLRFPNLPVLQVQPKDKGTYVPMEVCTMLPEQHCKRRLTELQTANMIKKTCKSPQMRFKEIRQRLEETRKHCAPFLDHFGIRLGQDLVQVESRVLKPPVVVYQSPDCFTPNQGFWNISSHRFFQAVQIDCWLILNYGNCSPRELETFSTKLQEEARKLGMEIAPPKDIKNLCNERRLGAEEILRRSKPMYPGLQLVVLVIPTRSNLLSNYSDIKIVGDTELGIVTQCIKDVNVSRKCNPSLLGNLCQKINAKLGGINNTVTPEKPFKQPSIFQEPILVLGADVTHPSPGDHSPSIAAVVGSLDRYPSRFAARVRVQKSTLGGIQSRVEMIQDLEDMVKSLLKEFHHQTRQKPQRILFYRDGVSETQFPEVLHYEVAQIRKACQAMNPNYKPALTFLCVQKRHRTRFCPKNLSDACGKAGNVPPGTTVDTGIVSPVDFDFFLCSHYGLQGTSRPTHYSVLLDENDMSADQVQAVSYALCHTYARCTRSLSIPAPVQYAHLAAFRARSHISKVMDFSSDSSNGGEPCYDSKATEIERAVKVVEELQNQMYFV